MATVKYFQANKVRVVNMSWGWTLKEVEGMLEANGIGKDAEEREVNLPVRSLMYTRMDFTMQLKALRKYYL